MTLEKLNIERLDEVKALFYSVFTQPPWNDDWSDEQQLDKYVHDIMGNKNSLTYGLYEDGILIGASMGWIMHWYTGTEYIIQEFFIKREKQGSGCGTKFLGLLEQDLKANQMTHIFLQTEHDVPAYKFYKKNGFTEMTTHVSFFKELK